MAGWPYILCLVIGSVQQASSLKTTPVLSRGPLLLISCSCSLFDLPINGQNNGTSLGASWRRVMLGRHVTDGTERARHIRGVKVRGRSSRPTVGTHTEAPVFVTERESKVNLKLKSNEELLDLWGRFLKNPITLKKITSHWAMIQSCYFFFSSVKCKWEGLTVQIRSKLQVISCEE